MQNLVYFVQLILKIVSRNEIHTIIKGQLCCNNAEIDIPTLNWLRSMHI